jgi:ribokinase
MSEDASEGPEDASGTSKQVLCAGHVNWDVTLRVERLPAPDGEVRVVDRLQKGGGSAGNVACGLVGLDTPAGLFASVGDDRAGRRALEELASVGVDVSRMLTVPDAATAVKYLLVDGSGEVMVLSSAGANEAFEVDDLGPDALADIDHLHLTSQRPDTAVALARRASEDGIPVSFDPGRRLEERDYSATFDHVDVLFLNRLEATSFVDGSGLDAIAEDTILVLKLGEAGAEVRTPDGVVSHHGFAIDPLDTTGAGDAFAAGFIASTHRDGGIAAADWEAALETANACGAIAALTMGARTDLSWARIESFVADHG